MIKLFSSLVVLVFLTGCQSSATKPLSFEFERDLSLFEHEPFENFGDGRRHVISDYTQRYVPLIVFPAGWKTMHVTLSNYLDSCYSRDVYRGTGSAVTLAGVTTSSVKIKKGKDTKCVEGFGLSQEQTEDYLYLAAALAVEKNGRRYFSIGEHPGYGPKRSTHRSTILTQGDIDDTNMLVFYKQESVDVENSTLQIIYLLDREEPNDWAHSNWFSDSFGVTILDSVRHQSRDYQQYRVTYSDPIEYDAEKVKSGILNKYGLSAESVASAIFKKRVNPFEDRSKKQESLRMQQYRR